jgi:hypothetical protein
VHLTLTFPQCAFRFDHPQCASHVGRPATRFSHGSDVIRLHRYLLRGYEGRAQVRGLGLLASAPPQGSGAMIKRFFRKHPIQSILLTWCLSPAQNPILPSSQSAFREFPLAKSTESMPISLLQSSPPLQVFPTALIGLIWQARPHVILFSFLGI